MSEDVLQAIDELELTEYKQPLLDTLEAYRKSQAVKKSKRAEQRKIEKESKKEESKQDSQSEKEDK